MTDTPSTPQVSSPLTVDQVAAQLRISKEGVRRHIAAGRIEAFDAGNGTKRRFWRITPEAVQAFKTSRNVSKMIRRRRRGEHLVRVRKVARPVHDYVGPDVGLDASSLEGSTRS